MGATSCGIEILPMHRQQAMWTFRHDGHCHTAQCMANEVHSLH